MSRTQINDFQEAAEAIALLLAKYSTTKDSGTTPKWLSQGVDVQTKHVQSHLDTVSQIIRPMPMEAFNFEDFVSLGCRGLMLLQHAILKYPEEFQKWRDEAKKGCPTED
jgi:hypothetical protein